MPHGWVPWPRDPRPLKRPNHIRQGHYRRGFAHYVMQIEPSPIIHINSHIDHQGNVGIEVHGDLCRRSMPEIYAGDLCRRNRASFLDR